MCLNFKKIIYKIDEVWKSKAEFSQKEEEDVWNAVIDGINYSGRHWNDGMFNLIREYSQTWVNNHLRIATNYLQRPLFWGLNFSF